ncbi:hypothetical protein BIV25_41005 [Streptomyces sp. MUSC 14]|nr:hypothetical protein BIV25_41005 [Streptomyces sp. MUSC 14]
MLTSRCAQACGERSRPMIDITRPPSPVPGCAACAELAERREAAQATYDRSAEVDANVLLRQHQRREHQA